MASKELNVKVKLRYDTASNWTANNPVLLAGELGIESDTRKMKVGDGTTSWSSLKYITVNDLSDYVTLNTDQEISGEKKFKVENGLYVWLSNVYNSDTGSILPAIRTDNGLFDFYQILPNKSGTIALLDDVPDISGKMDKENPTGTGSFSLNRMSGWTVGSQSFVHGRQCRAINTGGHAEGYYTTSQGVYDHAEGYETDSSGNSSHAEGRATEARGNYSHAEGYGTVTSSKSQHTLGEYNEWDSTESISSRGKFVEIVGNGTSDESRSNARTLDWEGNEYLAGNLQASGLTDGVTTKSMTEVLAGGGLMIRRWAD